MTTTDTIKENITRKRFAVSFPLFIAGIVTVLIGFVIVGWGRFTQTTMPQKNVAVSPPVAATASQDVYVMVLGWDGENTVLALDPASGKVNHRFAAGYHAIVKLTADRDTLYIYNQAYSENATMLKGTVSAVDTNTGSQLWQVDIPGEPFGPSTEAAWLSADEQQLYLQGSPDNLHPHIFVVNTQSPTLLHDFELPLPYPSNIDQAFPLVRKLPWAETLIAVSRDQLFTFDLTSGQTSSAIELFDRNAINRVPLNLPYNTFVWDGTIALERQQLFLATSTQEILVVNLGSQPFTVTSVASLPDGWQFAVMQPLLYHPVEEAIYVQVKQTNTPIIDRLEAEEVWVYDTDTWTRSVRLNLQEDLASASVEDSQNSSAKNLDLTNYGLALSPDGQSVYSLNERGWLQINRDSDNRVYKNWLGINEEVLGPFAILSVVP